MKEIILNILKVMYIILYSFVNDEFSINIIYVSVCTFMQLLGLIKKVNIQCTYRCWLYSLYVYMPVF